MNDFSDSTAVNRARADATQRFTASRYTSQAFLRRELDHLFGRCWLILARDSDLPRAGDRLPVDELDASLLLVRGDDGRVRTFHNTCRHRGTRLASRPCGGQRITCPYHGWSYGLDGRLVDVPKPEGFRSLDHAALGLHEVRTESWGGFVWACFDPEAPPLAEHLGAVVDQWSPYRLEDMRPLVRRTWELPCNWKAVIDQATETYHVDPVHGGSVGRFVDTAAETVATFYGLDPHHLQTLPILDSSWRPWLDRMCTPVDLDFTADQLRLMHKYVVFPNAVVNVLPYHLTVFRVFPLAPDRCRLRYGFYVRRDQGMVARVRNWLTVLASLYILREDFRMLAPFQEGVRAAGDVPISFHREERPLDYFHTIVDRHLGEASADEGA